MESAVLQPPIQEGLQRPIQERRQVMQMVWPAKVFKPRRWSLACAVTSSMCSFRGLRQKCARTSFKDIRSELRKKGVESLQRAGIDADEAKSSVKWMLQELERRGKPDQETFMHWVHRRAKREPLQYILGSWPFYPLPIELLVRAPVLIPRPETEELVDLVISEVQINNLWPNRSWPLRIVDFGSGSGAMILALLHTWPKATGMAVDPAEAAIALTSENALRCGVKERLSLFHGTAKEFAEAWSGDDFDLIVSNPPYIPSLEIPNLQPDVRDFEDHGALDGGQDGLVVVAEVLQTARAVGEVGARIFLEVHHTHPSVFEALEERAAPSLLAALEGLRLVQTVHDAYGQPRFVVLEVLDKASRVEDSREKKQELTP
ncbi:unnamed protein product [Durusdinium trenchii]|uniref:peptide chain release factor N(5)-glutamine methyltransferase n=1 Tax=Durusdinium trenchii TaxID=1381693 RepID=A0ABP0ISJ5_9DINO